MPSYFWGPGNKFALHSKFSAQLLLGPGNKLALHSKFSAQLLLGPGNKFALHSKISAQLLLGPAISSRYTQNLVPSCFWCLITGARGYIY